MSEWKAKRFWTEVAVVESEDGFEVRLDSRSVKTPAKATLRMPTEALAKAVAEEWEAVTDVIDPKSMPVTLAANSAIDKVIPQFAEVAALVADYGGSDLVCYRAEAPESLVQAQAVAWDPLVDWAATELHAPLTLATGVMHVEQPETTLKALRDQVLAQDAFCLTALSDLVGLSGSLVVGLAAARGYAPIESLWAASRVDEIWQASQWGQDDEAEALARLKSTEFARAARIYALCQDATFLPRP